MFNIKFLAKIVSIIGGGVAIVIGYITLGGPIPVTRGWMDQRLHNVECQLLKVRKHVNTVDLFEWKDHNRGPQTQQVQEQINNLQTSITDIDRQLSTLSC